MIRYCWPMPIPLDQGVQDGDALGDGDRDDGDGGDFEHVVHGELL